MTDVLPVLGRVLVPTDFSEDAERAFLYACALAPPGGRVRVIHVIHPRAIGGGQIETRLGYDAGHARYVDELRERLLRLADKEQVGATRQVEVEVVDAETPWRGICEEAERMDADVIVLASHGITGLASAIAGSVTRDVLAHSRRPVFLIRIPAP